MFWSGSYSENPWSMLSRMEHQMAKLFADGFESNEFPALNVLAGENEVLVTCEIPGVRLEDIELSVSGELLSIKGKREEESENGTCRRRERGFGTFARAIKLPFGVEAGEVKAEYRNGVLNVRLPRKESDKPRRITVK